MGCGASTNSSKVKNKSDQVDQDEIDQAILELRVTRNKLQKYQQQQEHTQEVELAKAKELLGKGYKDRAKAVLRQRKARERYIENAQGMIANVEDQIDKIQSAQMALQVFDNLKGATQILKQMNDLMPVEEVEALMDENAEETAKLQEVNQLLAQRMNPSDLEAADEDYDQLLAELAEENEAEENGGHQEVTNESNEEVDQIPEIPSDIPPINEQNDQESITCNPEKVAIPA